MSAKPEISAEDMVTIEIDGVSMQARKGAMIIHAADDSNIYIPRFCYHKKLPIAANCRMCLVEVANVPKPLPACATPVAEGMKVFTRSAFAKKAQKAVMEFLLINHPLDCPICDQGGECELQDIAMGYGGSSSRFTEGKRVVQDKNIGPLIATEMTRCIHCTRCIRTLELVNGESELGAMNRGNRTTIGTYIERSVNSEMSGNVIDVCPVGALTAKPSRFAARAWEMRAHNSIAAHDCVGSNISVHTYNNKAVRTVPDENEAVNEVWLSDRDRYAYAGLNSTTRLTTPMIKVGAEWQEIDWNTALDEVVTGLRDQSEAIGCLVSPNATTEEAFLAQRLLRGLGSQNIDHRLGQQDFSDDGRLPLVQSLGCGVDALESVNAALLIGSNIRHDQPIASHRLRKAVAKGGQLMLLNHVDYDMNYPLAEKIITSPSTMTTELAAIVKAMLETTQESAPPGLAALIDSVSVTDTHRAIADHLKTAENASVIIGMQAMAMPNLSTLRALAALLARLADASFGYLPRGANSSGASLAGALPYTDAGGQGQYSGLNAVEMMKAKLSAYVLLNVEPELDCIDPAQARRALANANFVVCMTPFVSDAMREYANVLLPTAPSTETSGTFVNASGRWQRFAAACAPRGETRPAWKVLRVLGNLCELSGFEYLSSEEVRAEVERETNAVTLDNQIEWRCPAGLASADELVRIGDMPIYGIDNVVRRAAALQNTIHAASESAAMNAATAKQLGVGDASRIVLTQGDDEVSVELMVDECVPNNCVMLAASSAASSQLGAPYQAVTITKD
ncbi:NADH-quinone oxidoreductase subunit NuoG [Sulfuriflexus mobilis]|uniref:NADH-quinone oxidoreductase subunit NuoG n=1 Tax=Sulfuriflexus mobilis TaxID=1811807 RepID=UPI001E3A801D|nr:NADH-quinone oxidoreductase subunit NuoG [Sulfuriflexus mobilis]